MSLTHQTAARLSTLMSSGEVSATEVMQAHIERIEAVNPVVNAIVDFQPEQALDQARHLDKTWRKDDPHGLLYGLPFATKDLIPAKGFRYTQGTKIFGDRVAEVDHTVVEREKAAGGIIVGKTNVPEFGLGSHTFNDVYGVTRNPFNLDKSAGGSSGGAAAALAARMLPVADGSDTGGSLRNPASFCNVVGLRPSLGRVPSWPNSMPYSRLSVNGPMGRTVSDVALLLQVLAGADSRSPGSVATRPGEFFPLDGSVSPRSPRSPESPGEPGRKIRVAWSPNLDGAAQVGREVLDALEPVIAGMRHDGWEVELFTPDLSGAFEAFSTFRALQMQATLGPLVREFPDAIKEDAKWNVRLGELLDGLAVAKAELAQVRLLHTMREFFDSFDLLVTPTCQVAPFDLTERYPRAIDGIRMQNYLDWMRLPSIITATGCPSISVPAAFTPDGLPVGLQLIGPRLGESRLLEHALAFEQSTDVWKRVPEIDPRVASRRFVEIA